MISSSGSTSSSSSASTVGCQMMALAIDITIAYSSDATYAATGKLSVYELV
jgi:hypothetical protein